MVDAIPNRPKPIFLPEGHCCPECPTVLATIGPKIVVKWALSSRTFGSAKSKLEKLVLFGTFKPLVNQHSYVFICFYGPLILDVAFFNMMIFYSDVSFREGIVFHREWSSQPTRSYIFQVLKAATSKLVPKMVVMVVKVVHNLFYWFIVEDSGEWGFQSNKNGKHMVHDGS